jgi:integrase
MAHRVLFVLAIESAMRLREMYTLTLDQIDIAKRTIFLDKTKNGDKRQVPMSSVVVAVLRDHMETRELPEGHPADLLFPWWDGDRSQKALVGVSDYLSKRFLDIFQQAGAVGLKFHDLRHEAVSRLFERTTLSESQIMKISGHKSHRMMMRYANLRGSDLAASLW